MHQKEKLALGSKLLNFTRLALDAAHVETVWSALFDHIIIESLQVCVFLVYLSQQHCESHSLVAEFSPKCDVPIKRMVESMFCCFALRFSVYQ